MALLRVAGLVGRTRGGAPLLAAPANVAAGGTGNPTPDPDPGTANYIRGRPILSNGTVKSEIGTLLRGVTMALDGPGSTATNYTLDRSNWQRWRDLGFNVVRLPFSVAYEGLTLSQQLPDLDKAVANASATGLYCMMMLDGAYGVANYAEFKDVWPTVCARYKDNTNVFFEMNNEPHWQADEFTNAELDEIGAVYSLMRSNAPNSLIGIFTPAALQTTDIISKADAMLSRGVTYDKTFIATHVYGTYSRSNVQALKNAYPCMMTETVSGGPNNNTGVDNEVFKIGEMEAVGVSWQVLQARFGEVSNRDTPYSNDQTSLTDRILPGIRANGITWAQDPLTGTTTPGGGTGGTPAIVSVTGDIANAKVGQTTTLTVTATGTTSVDWTVVSAAFAWRNNPPINAALNASGIGTIPFVPTAVGDFVKVMIPGNQAIFKDTAAVPAPAGTGGGSAFPQPNANSFYQDFSSNNGGILNHTWGNRAALSYSGGIMRIEAVPGAPGDDGACGVMQFPSAADAGFGYGFYEWRVRFFGGGPGPCALLWASDDRWPPGEDDMGEIDGGGNWYCAHHFDPTDGESIYEAYRSFYYRDAFPSRGDLPRGQWVTVGTLLKPGSVEFSVDVGNGHESIGRTTKNATPMYIDGGVNRVFGLMHRGDRLDTAIEGQWFRHTPL